MSEILTPKFELYMMGAVRRFFGDKWFTEDELLNKLYNDPHSPTITTKMVTIMLDKLVGIGILTRTIGRSFKCVESPVAFKDLDMAGNVPISNDASRVLEKLSQETNQEMTLSELCSYFIEDYSYRETMDIVASLYRIGFAKTYVEDSGIIWVKFAVY